MLINADGGLGYAELAPYDRISVTAAWSEFPPPLIEQLAPRGRLIAPISRDGTQDLIVLEKTTTGIRQQVICEVLYVALQGIYGK